jgi:hypothetical protein
MPTGIWIVAGIYLMHSVLALSSYFLLIAGIFPAAQGQTGRELLEAMGPLEHLQTIGLGLLELAAGVSLLLRKRFAVWLFSIDFLAAVALIARRTLGSGLQGQDLTSSVIFPIWALLMSTCACAYAWHLYRQRILR